MKKDLILGYIHGYQWPQVAPFVNSLRDTDFSGDICFFASGTNEATRKTLRETGIQVIEVPTPQFKLRRKISKLWWLFRLAPQKLHRPLLKSLGDLLVLRYILYEEFLSQQGQNYNRVLITDIRDVVFQKNPFSCAPQAGIHFFEEAKGRTIASEPKNSKWIRRSFGRKIFNEYADKPILCFGTIMGTTGGIRDFINFWLPIVSSARSIKPCVDQGAFNVAVPRYPHQHYQTHKNGESLVLTMGLMSLTDLIIDSDGQVTDQSGKIIPLLHQFDRISQINRSIKVLNKWPVTES
jgi:hypothetical protein